MQKFHINLKGEVKPCPAQKQCRLSPSWEHFTTKEEAQIYADKANELEQEYIYLTKNEPIITSDLQDIMEANGSRLEGLEYRVKALSGVKEKVLVRKNVNSINDLYDVIRYTSMFSTEEYKEGYNNVIKDLINKNYQVINIKNTWNNNGYKGINCKFEDENGIKFELQFHTPESLQAKEKAHRIYEEQRLIQDVNSLEFIKMDEDMNKIFNDVPNPFN